MKTLIVFLAFILGVTQLLAQVKTGGGGGPDPDSNDIKLQEYEAKKRLKYIFADLSKELIRIEKSCNGRKSVPDGYNFVDSFYTLSLKENDELICTPKVAKCLRTKELKSLMAEINQTPGAVLYKYLETEYKLDKKSAETILKFFNSVGAGWKKKQYLEES